MIKKLHNIIKNNHAFTLIETLVYMGLFTIVIGGSLIGVYQIIQGSDRLTKKTELQEEANFLTRKIDWALTGGTILTPAANTTSSVLRINKINFSNNPLEFTIQNKNLELSRAGGSPETLNSSFVEVQNAVFEHSIGTSSLGRVLKITLTLNNETFISSKYLPK